MYKITQEMKNEYQEARKAMIKQWDYLEKAIPRIKHWAKKIIVRFIKLNVYQFLVKNWICLSFIKQT